MVAGCGRASPLPVRVREVLVVAVVPASQARHSAWDEGGSYIFSTFPFPSLVG